MVECYLHHELGKNEKSGMLSDFFIFLQENEFNELARKTVLKIHAVNSWKIFSLISYNLALTYLGIRT